MTTAGERELSLPEVLQLALPTSDGKLWPGTVNLIAATVIDLALRGRIEATPARRGFSWDAKLTVVDDTPLGIEPLDSFMQALTASGNRRKIKNCIPKFGVSAATSRSLADRGLVAVHGNHLEPLDAALRAECVARLTSASTSNDVRDVALLDISQWSENGWTAQAGQLEPPILGAYPPPVALIAEGALNALFIATGTSS